MNREIISKLYKEAVDYCVEQGPNPDGTNKAWIWEEKFTELIVKECADIVHDRILEIDIEFPGKDVTKSLKEYFGVDE